MGINVEIDEARLRELMFRPPALRPGRMRCGRRSRVSSGGGIERGSWIWRGGSSSTSIGGRWSGWSCLPDVTMIERVVADTSAWIEFLRGTGSGVAAELRGLLGQGRVVMCGVVLAELLQGVRAGGNVDRLTRELLALPFVPLGPDGYASAGRRGRELRGRGITLPLSDLLVATAASASGLAVLTADAHFLPIDGLRIHPPLPSG